MTTNGLASETILNLIDLLKSSGGLKIDAEILHSHAGQPSDSPSIIVNFSGEDAPLLARNHGELLKALHEMASVALGLQDDELDRLWFDVDHLRAARTDELQRIAQAAIAHVRDTGQSYAFAPMPSCERHMLHQALVSSDLRYASLGEGMERRVVLYPSEMLPQERSSSRQPSPPPSHHCDAA